MAATERTPPLNEPPGDRNRRSRPDRGSPPTTISGSVRHEGSSSLGFALSVSLRVGEDELAPLQCPADAAHRLKVALTQSTSGESSDCCS
jgi:hypothetical protein